MQADVQPLPRPAPAFPWLLVVLVVALFSSATGGPWDISWHLTIGRDTFWTPAHIAIYLGGATAGFACGWLAIRTTFFASDAERSAAVNFWGGRAPFGAWIVIWGAVAMLTAGPFDDWWHNAYGLDVKIISPPHVVLFLGGTAVRFGSWLLVLREQNRGSAAAPWLFCIVGGLLIEELTVIFMVEFWPNRQHSDEYFFLAAATFPFLLTALSRATRLRWGATLAAGTYMVFVCALVWILPLFPAVTKLGPINHPVTHMVPPPFPQWLILPALAIDVMRQRFGTQRQWGLDLAFAAIVSVIFLFIFFPTQWFFSQFLLTPAADNWLFAGNRMWGYTSAPAGTPRLHEFWMNEHGWELVSVAKAAGAAFVMALLGRRFGHWMSEVKR